MAKSKVDISELKFNKQQFLESKLFANERDLVQALVNDDEVITIDELKTRIEEYMKGKVNS